MGEVAVPRPRVRQALGSSVEVTVAGEPGVLTVGRGPGGAPCVLQLRAGVHGSTLAGLADALATAITVGLQHGVPGAALTDALHRAELGCKGENVTRLLVETFASADRPGVVGVAAR
jgi:ribonucleoside-diphosphate reductase alpha chain